MKTRNVTERIGECLGPVDWSHDFAQYFANWSIRDKEQYVQRHVDWLRQIAESPDSYEVTTDGGCPKIGWHRVLDVGMYDGWPYWRPVPSVCLLGTLGAEWHAFHNITGVMPINAAQGE
jgi:hypothetical protein